MVGPFWSAVKRASVPEPPVAPAPAVPALAPPAPPAPPAAPASKPKLGKAPASAAPPKPGTSNPPLAAPVVAVAGAPVVPAGSGAVPFDVFVSAPPVAPVPKASNPNSPAHGQYRARPKEDRSYLLQTKPHHRHRQSWCQRSIGMSQWYQWLQQRRFQLLRQNRNCQFCL